MPPLTVQAGARPTPDKAAPFILSSRSAKDDVYSLDAKGGRRTQATAEQAKGLASARPFHICLQSRGLSFLIDRAFGDFGQGRVGFLFLGKSLFEEPDRIV